MTVLHRLLAASLALAAASSFAASTASTPASAPIGPGPGPAMGSGMGPGMGPGAGRGMHIRWNDRNSPGWSMMSAQERQEHQARMSSFTSADECHAYLDQHHQEMMTRAAAQNRKLPAHPPYDACARLKKTAP